MALMDALRQVLSLTTTFKKRIGVAVASLAVIGTCAAVRTMWGPTDAEAQSSAIRRTSATEPASRRSATKLSAPARPEIMAVVNGQQIRREELARECLRHYGKEVLEAYVNKHLISIECRRRGVNITQAMINAEIDRMAKKFKLERPQYLQLLEQERGINRARYAKDIVWPMLALRQLAADRLTVSPEELRKAYESDFGPAVRVQMIQLDDPQQAEQIYGQLIANPDQFGRLAGKHSIDKNSASAKGWIQPIRRHIGEPTLERVAFSLREGEISRPITVPLMSGRKSSATKNTYVILKCHGQSKAPQAPRRRDVRKQLIEKIRDGKLRVASSSVFAELQKNLHVENIFNDPEKRRQFPGVAARINGHPIAIRDLAEECLDRHGEDVLVGKINQKLLEQALERQKLEVTREEIESEIARAAVAMAHTTKSGAPDRQSWINFITKQQGVSEQVYITDAVWPSAALKKLVGGKVEVTNEDIQKAYDATYGRRVICQAILMDDMRRAQRVWDMARKKPTEAHFARLAEEYTLDAGGREIGGQIPPIERNGGRPQLEREAFQLQVGEISSIISLGDKLVILRCKGHTRPQKISLADVRDELYDDLHERKLRRTMARRFEQLRRSANIENYLTGEVHEAKKIASRRR
jgi:parvulin-like peptidyl-prolyl isomerase